MESTLFTLLIVLAQVAPVPDWIDKFAQFGAAGVLLVALVGFGAYLERRDKRHDAIVQQWLATLEGLRKDLAALTTAVNQLDSDVRSTRRRS